MTKIINNPLLKGASGMLGGAVVFRLVRGNLIMAKRPAKPRVLTDHQRNAKAKFLRGVEYARKQLADPVTRAEYAAGITDRKFSAFLVALTDSLTAPRIDQVNISQYGGAKGDKIAIRATDDFKVTSVHVTISDNAGVVVEQGEAVLAPGAIDEWYYTATTFNTSIGGAKIKIAAYDKPGNVAVSEKIIESGCLRDGICAAKQGADVMKTDQGDVPDNPMSRRSDCQSANEVQNNRQVGRVLCAQERMSEDRHSGKVRTSPSLLGSFLLTRKGAAQSYPRRGSRSGISLLPQQAFRRVCHQANPP